MGALMGLLVDLIRSFFAQVKIGDNQANVNPNSLLELESSSKGLLIPRMTTEQRDAAFQADTAPVGLIIFNTTEQTLQILQQAEFREEDTNKTRKKGRPTEKLWATFSVNETQPKSDFSPQVGQVIYNPQSEMMEVFNGEEWISIGSKTSATFDLPEMAKAIEKINTTLQNILEGSRSDGSNNNQDNTPVSADELATIFDRVIPENESAYQQAIIQATHLNNPPTADQIQTIIDAVNDDATPPIFTSPTVVSINENIGEDQLVYTAQATDSSLPIRYNIAASDIFLIDSNSGEVRLIPNPDYEDQAQYTVEITATDLALNQASLDLVVNINDLDETPPINPILLEILEDSASPGGNNNQDNDPVTADELSQLVDNVDSNREQAYQQAIANHTQFSNPPTLTEIQAVVDAVNSTLDNVLEDSASPGGNNNQDNDPVTAAELSQIVDNVDINREQAYQQAIANHTQFSNPPTVAEIQAVGCGQ